MKQFSAPGRQNVTEAMADAAIRATATRAVPKDGQRAFVPGEAVVYPGHGVGRIDRIGTQEIGSYTMQVIQVSFAGNQMILRIPAATAHASGLRQVATRELVDEALAIVASRPRVSKGLWSRRATEIQAKITSGQIAQVAEVVRDLRRYVDKDHGNFSERQLFQMALDRLAEEVAALSGVDNETALAQLTKVLTEANAAVPAIDAEAVAAEA